MSRILIVDQDQFVVKAFERFGRSRNIDIVSAPTLDRGVHGAGGVCDLILIDEIAAGGVTQERVKNIYSRNLSTLIPVIAMTGARLSASQWKALGYSGYLPKPFSAEQVKQSLSRWLPELNAAA